MAKRLLLLSFLLVLQRAESQDFSNKGREFWIPYPEHANGTSTVMGIYFTSDVPATVTLKVGAVTLPSFVVPADSVIRKFIGPNAGGDAPNTGVYMGGIQDGIGAGRAIQVTSDRPIVVFAHIIFQNRSGATLVLPKTVWGREYIVPSFGNTGSTPSYGEVNIIASQPNTQVEITPTRTSRNGARVAGTPFTVTIPNVGDVYQLQAQLNQDLSGTRIRSIATGTSGCVPIAVFSATTWSGFPCIGASGGDNLYQQLFPVASWGKEFITSPLKRVVTTASDNNVDYVRVYVQDPATIVTRTENGTTTTLTGLVTPGNYYQYTTSNPTRIQANIPVQAVQFISSQTCGTPQTSSDPEMIVLSPVEQTINNINVFSAHQGFVPMGQSNVTTHYLNVVMKTANTGSFRINGLPPTAPFTPIPGTAFSFLKENLTARAATNPIFKLRADSGFNAIAYGFGNFESYGYNAGTFVKDLYQYISVETPNATVRIPTTCRNTPFFFSMTFPYKPTRLQWVFGTALNAAGIADTTLLNPVPSDSTVVNGRKLYGYRLPRQYSVATVGLYPVRLIANNPTPDGCSGEQEINFDFDVLPNPVAGLSAPNVCQGLPVNFTDTSKTSGRSLIKYLTYFGDNTSANTLNPSKTYADSGNYTVKYVVTTDVGCVSDTFSTTVRVRPTPAAAISGTDSVCLNATAPRITFRGAPALPPYTFSYNINGGATQTVTTAATADTVSIPVPTAATGVFTYNLLAVREGSPNACAANTSGAATVTVLTKPAAAISGTVAVCHNTSTQPLVTFTGTDGLPPYTFTYTLNGGAPQTIATSPTASTATIPVPTGTVGTFAYTLVSVSDANGAECRQNASGTATVTVNPLPTASITGTDSVCLNSTQPAITFSGAGATTPYTFAYNINGGPTLTVTSPATTATATVNVPTSPRGVFTYNLLSVTDASSTACAQNQSGSATLTVLPTPAAAISGTTAVCHNNPAQPLVTFSGTGGDAPYTFTYTLNGGAPQTIATSATASTVTLPVPTATVGTFAYTLVSVSDANGTECRQNASGTATVTVNPLPTASIAGTTSLCRNAAAPRITFTGAGATRPYTFAYRIDAGPTLTVTTASSDTVSVPVPTGNPGTFTYTLLSVTDASSTACTQNQSGSAAVTVWPLPSAAYSSNSPVCATGTIAFSDRSTPNSAALSAWQWNFDDPASGTRNTSSLTNPSHVFDNPGTYNIALTVTNSNGCTSVNSLPPFTVNPRPKAGFVIPEVCLNDTYAQFLDSSKVAAPASITQWSWNFGDPNWNTPPTSPNTASDKDPRHSYKAVGNYDVSLIVTSNHGCKDTIVQRLVVNGSFPVARFRVLNTDNLCANDSIAIVDSSTVFPGVITKVLIYWDDVNNPTVAQTDDNTRLGKVYRHLYPNFQSPLSKTYRIRFRAYSGGVCLNETAQTITVNAAPKTRFNPIPDICYDASPYQITQAAETGGVPGTFAFSGPGVSPSGLFNPAAAGEGTHTIQYKFTSATGGCADSVTQTVKVWKRAIADFRIASAPVCEKQPVTLADTSSSQEGAISRWQWNFGDGSPIATRTSPTPFPHTFPAFGTYPVTLSVTTANGCTSAPKTLNLTVQPLARPNFSFPPVSCLPNAVIPFTNASSVPGSDTSTLSYRWNFGDPASGPVNTSTARHPAHTYANLGPFNVNLRVTTQAGCIHDTTIVLNTIHPQPIADFSISAADVCLGGPLQLDNTSNTQDGTLKSLLWNLGDGNTQTIPSFSHTYATTGNYTITLQITNSFDCPSTIASKTVSINPNPVADAGPNRVVLEGGQITINASASNANGLTYLWTPQKGLNDPTLLNPIAFPDSSTRYLLTVTSDKGCTDTSSMFLKVLYKPVVMNTFTPNGDGVNDKWDILYIDSYPGAVIEVYNTSGQLVFRTIGYNIPWDGTLNGKPLPTGTYYYVINPKNGRAKMAGYVTIIR